MLTVMEAIKQRRSIRKYKPDPVPEDVIRQLLEAARLAPSASNRQSWRFQVITDPALKEKLYNEGTFAQRHVLEAPVVIACGSEMLTFVKGHALAPPGADYWGSESAEWDTLKQFVPDAQMNAAIAIEHMVLLATALGLGTCWVQRIRFGQVARILGWPRNVVVHILLTVGYPAEELPPRPRHPAEHFLMGRGQPG